jgi:acyl-CoA synthetase (AMP-forming)/AMP-acid ligase II
MQDLLLRSAARTPDKNAIETEDQAWSFQRLADRTRQYANALVAAGLEPGGRAALLMENGPEYVAAYFGVFLAGGIAIPLDVKAQPSWYESVLSDCDVELLITSPQYFRHLGKMNVPRLNNVVTPSATNMTMQIHTNNINVDAQSSSDIDRRVDPAAPALINYTSGSSGRPKGVVMSHRAILANTRSIVVSLGLQQHDRVMQILPLSYCYGASLLHTHLMVGGTITIDNRFQYPSVVLEHLRSARCTGFAGVPSTFHTLVTRCKLNGSDYPDLRYVTQAGGRMQPDLVDSVRNAIAPARLYLMYGQTEASARLTCLEPERWQDKRGSAGRPIPGVNLKIIREDGSEASTGEPGDIWVAGDNLMSGYWRQPVESERVLRAGWLRTGDVGRVDEDGFLYIEGRRSDLIKCQGYRISPAEVEEVVNRHPAIREVAIVGLPDSQCGEIVSAVLALKQGASLSAEDLERHCRQLLPAVKVPRRVITVDQLPRSSTGKIQREALVKLFA